VTALRKLLATLIRWELRQVYRVTEALERFALELEPCPFVRIPSLVGVEAGNCSACGEMTAGSCERLGCPFFCCLNKTCREEHRRLFHNGEEQPPHG
jgi:hypothetical protein